MTEVIQPNAIRIISEKSVNPNMMNRETAKLLKPKNRKGFKGISVADP
jgi:hypothetical protein